MRREPDEWITDGLFILRDFVLFAAGKGFADAHEPSAHFGGIGGRVGRGRSDACAGSNVGGFACVGNYCVVERLKVVNLEAPSIAAASSSVVGAIEATDALGNPSLAASNVAVKT